MIKLNPAPTFKAEVEITVPGEETPAKVEFEFRALNNKRLLSLLILTRIFEKRWPTRFAEYVKLCWRLKKLASVVDMLDELIIGWNGIEEPYGRAALRTLLVEFSGSCTSIYLAYLQGHREARRKN